MTLTLQEPQKEKKMDSRFLDAVFEHIWNNYLMTRLVSLISRPPARYKQAGGPSCDARQNKITVGVP